MAIPTEHQNALVDASLHFMRALGNAYGSERAMDFWSTLSEVVDPELKGLTFAAMLSGRTGELIVIKSLPLNPDKIGIIKAIRNWDKRSLGLKEAKDMLDEHYARGSEINLEVTYQRVPEARAEFIRLGCRGIGL